MRKFILCMVGFPASGKSTFARKSHEKLKFNLFHLDDYFEEDFKAEKSQRSKVSEKIQELLGDSSTFGVIVDDLNHLRSLRHFWFSLGAKFKNVTTVYLWMTTESQICRERNSARKNPVPRDSFEKIVEQFETVGNRYFEENLIKISETPDIEKIVLEI